MQPLRSALEIAGEVDALRERLVHHGYVSGSRWSTGHRSPRPADAE